MTSIRKLSTLIAVGALLAAPVAMAQQSGTSTNQGANAGSATGTKTNLNPGGSDHDVGMANSQGSSYHMNDPANFKGNTNNGWNANNTGDAAPTNPQNTAVNGGQQGSNNR